MNLKEELEKIALAQGMDYFGVGPPQRWENAPQGHRPGDFMPSVKSVIVIGIRIPEGAIESNHRAFQGLRHGIFTYMLFGYNKLNELLDYTAIKMSSFLQTEATASTYLLPASTPRDEYLMMGEMSSRHAAVCAGLAEFGWNGLALTPDAGPRVRWVTLLTDAPLEPDPLYSGTKLCDHTTCSICVNVCPVQALSEDIAVELSIEDQKLAYGKLDRARCRCGVTGLAKGTAGRLQADIPESLNGVEGWLQLAANDDEWNKMERVASMCGRCMTMCPVGRV